MIYYKGNITWEWMGPGGSCGLQNRSFGTNLPLVGSIPTHSRHKVIKASEVFAPGAFCFYERIDKAQKKEPR